MNAEAALLVFLLDGQRYGLHLSHVERVLPAMEATPLPQAPSIVCGIINIGGRIIPLIALRQRFGLPTREISWDDQVILAKTPARTVGLLVDRTQGLAEVQKQEIVAAPHVLPGLDLLEGVVKLEDGLLLIHDLARCLSLEEEAALAAAMEGN